MNRRLGGEQREPPLREASRGPGSTRRRRRVRRTGAQRLGCARLPKTLRGCLDTHGDRRPRTEREEAREGLPVRARRCVKSPPAWRRKRMDSALKRRREAGYTAARHALAGTKFDSSVTMSVIGFPPVIDANGAVGTFSLSTGIVSAAPSIPINRPTAYIRIQRALSLMALERPCGNRSPGTRNFAGES